MRATAVAQLTGLGTEKLHAGSETVRVLSCVAPAPLLRYAVQCFIEGAVLTYVLHYRILQLAGPVFLQSLMGFSANIVSLAFVGHLGSLTLSQAVLGLSAYNVTGLSVLLGVSMGMETCCTQVEPTIS